MKTILPFSKSRAGVLLAKLLLATSFFANAQSGPGGTSGQGQSVAELVFKNPVIESGIAGADGATYRFNNVANNIDALVKIAGRSSSLVRITNIDLSNTGYDNAFQPQISYNNGSAVRRTDWWVDFNINFVNKATSEPATVTNFDVSALDVDGDGSALNEYVAFYDAKSFTVESTTLLKVKNLMDYVFDLLKQTPGKLFEGPTKGYNGVNVSATDVMATLNYVDKSAFRLRAGGTTGNSSSSLTDRMYSIWFKGFDYNNPVQTTLPVKLVSFSAFLTANDVVDLKWTTATEKNVSHFEIEKSLDGKNYEKAAVAFAFGNTTETINYAFTDKNVNINNAGMLYYRLRTVDNDGSSDLSHVRSIRIGKKSQQGMSIVAYPNPVTTTLQVTIPSSWQGKKVSYELYNNNGQSIFRSTVATGSQTESLDMSLIAPGFYIVRASCNGETAQEKIIKK